MATTGPFPCSPLSGDRTAGGTAEFSLNWTTRVRSYHKFGTGRADMATSIPAHSHDTLANQPICRGLRGSNSSSSGGGDSGPTTTAREPATSLFSSMPRHFNSDQVSFGVHTLRARKHSSGDIHRVAGSTIVDVHS